MLFAVLSVAPILAPSTPNSVAATVRIPFGTSVPMADVKKAILPYRGKRATEFFIAF